MGGIGIIIFSLAFLVLLGVLLLGLGISIRKKSKIGLCISIPPLLFLLYWVFFNPFNASGFLTKEPDPADLVATYRLDGGGSSSYISGMGYKDLSGSITLNKDLTFEAGNIPACCVHGIDESVETFSGGTYSFSGTWGISKSASVYVVNLSILQITGHDVPNDADLGKFFPSRVPRSHLELQIMKGKPLSVGFSVFNGDFDQIEFSRK